MPFPSVSILGCGWLGLPLAKILLGQGYHVKGSTTSLEKIPVLQKAGIFSFCLQVNDVVKGHASADFFASDIMVITVPFRRDLVDPRDYQKQIQAIMSECVKGGRVKFIIFTSSTSIYPQNIVTAAEDMPIKADNARAKVLFDIETELLTSKNFDATIIRLAGLYGPDRKLGAFLAVKNEMSDADSPVNFIHQDDAVGLIREIIVQNVRGQVFNGCSDAHPTRRMLYTAIAKQMDLLPPQFSQKNDTPKKIVVNDKVKKVLGYRFLHPDPLSDIVRNVDK